MALLTMPRRTTALTIARLWAIDPRRDIRLCHPVRRAVLRRLAKPRPDPWRPRNRVLPLTPKEWTMRRTHLPALTCHRPAQRRPQSIRSPQSLEEGPADAPLFIDLRWRGAIRCLTVLIASEELKLRSWITLTNRVVLAPALKRWPPPC
jgi:hypothetical protein